MRYAFVVAAFLPLATADSGVPPAQVFTCRAAGAQFERVPLPATFDPKRLVLRVALLHVPPSGNRPYLSIGFGTRGNSGFRVRIGEDAEWSGLFHVETYRPYRSRRFARGSMQAPRVLTITFDERNVFRVSTGADRSRTRVPMGWRGTASLNCGSSTWRVEVLDPANRT